MVRGTFACLALVLLFVVTQALDSRKDPAEPLLLIARLKTLSVSDIEALGNNSKIIPPTMGGINLTHPSPFYGVTMYQLLYAIDEEIVSTPFASGLLMVPESTDGQALPLLVYSHYTETNRAEVPSFLNSDSTALAIYFGSQGYVVMAPDYLGLGDSPGFHPYFLAEGLQAAATGTLRASVQALDQLEIDTNGQLFLTGYSEGGNTNMILHRHLELNLASEFKVTASASMAGPYDLPFSVKRVIKVPSNVDPRISSAELALLIISFQRVYGGIYTDPIQIFNPAIAPMAELAFDGLHTPEEVLGIFNGPPLQVLQPSFVADIYNNPNNRFLSLLKMSNAYNWTDWIPQAPLRFYQGGADTESPFENSELAVAWVRSLGVDTQLVNLGPKVTHGDGLLPGFMAVLSWFESLREY